jgi:hypothetical protein
LISRPKAVAVLFTAVAATALVALLLPPIPQPQSYHDFADHRAWLGIPNFGDVSSNLPFAVVGLSGLIFLLGFRKKEIFANPAEQWPYMIVFAGLVWTAFGSAYYHLSPNNVRLVWDRLPIMVVFMALLAAVIGERFSPWAGLLCLPIFLAIGAGSVFQWRASELRGHGDLRFYAAVQAGSILILLLSLLLPSRYTRGYDFGVVVGFYILAKIFEETDKQVFALGHIVSGHTLKHLAAAAAGYWILRMLQKRSPIPASA